MSHASGQSGSSSLSQATSSGGSAKAWRRIERLVVAGRHREALKKARDLHARQDTPASQALLGDVYVARLDGLLRVGLRAEARAILKSAWDVYPSLREHLLPMLAPVGLLDELLSPLADPDLSESRRREISVQVRRGLRDLDELATCEALPKEHTLRRDALALSRAFSAVTSGEVDGVDLSLAAVSRRSPLAPWKMLICALDCFYRRDDAAARRWLRTIEPDAATRPLADVLTGLLGEGSDTPSEAEELVEAVSARCSELRRHLGALDDAIERRDEEALLGGLPEAEQACLRLRPELVHRLRQHTTLRAILSQFDGDRVRSALGGPLLMDAYFWRLWAVFEERSSSSFARLTACRYWERLLCHALSEGWFDAGSVEEAVVLSHMADLLSGLSSARLKNARVRENTTFLRKAYESQPEDVRRVGLGQGRHPDRYYLNPAYLYDQACTIDPRSERFEAWLRWAARTHLPQRQRDRIAQRWHDALPQDSRPLLALVASAERRMALNKALGYLNEAEGVDGLNPEIRRARLRLLVRVALRHSEQDKPHLLKKDLLLLEEQLSGRGELLALVSAFGCVWRLLCGEMDLAREEAERTQEILSSRLAGLLVQKAVFDAACLSPRSFKVVTGGLGRFQVGGTAEYVRALTLLQEVDLSLAVPSGWYRGMSADVRGRRCPLTAHQLRSLAEGALAADRSELAYLATGEGLNLPDADVARFLLLRARSLPYFAVDRIEACLEAVVELARQRQDTGLLEDAAREAPELFYSLGRWDSTRDGPEVEAKWPGVQAFERSRRKYPKEETSTPQWMFGSTPGEGECDCPSCRERRRIEALERAAPKQQELDIESPEDAFPEDALPEDALPEDDPLEEMEGLQPGLEDLDLEAIMEVLTDPDTVPPGLVSTVKEIMRRFGTMPPPDVLEQVAPELFEGMMELVEMAESLVRSAAERRSGAGKRQPGGRGGGRRGKV